ncbi:UNVERIFIED_CONTAM: hypothetical protein K2H54_004991 [Gekko kuhli]
MSTRNLACPVSSIDSQDRAGQGTEHPQTPGAPAGGSSAPESGCHRDYRMSVAFRPMRHIVVYLPTCQPEDPGTRDASVQVGVTCEDKATQWEEREEADPSLDKSFGAYSTGMGKTTSSGTATGTAREFCQSGLLLSLWDMGGHGAGMADSESPREGPLCSHALREDPHSDFPGTGLHGPDATKPPPTFQEDPALPWLA